MLHRRGREIVIYPKARRLTFTNTGRKPIKVRVSIAEIMEFRQLLIRNPDWHLVNKFTRCMEVWHHERSKDPHEQR